ncbi:autotransporter domain-containing protein [Pseudovibrio sp. Tun.PSC04-5.I4]|uniref:autotransporter outer membrane beta-barrel domain-containing protein n=1 Tax=Pseudovibrio sp. Tun.PSC04-5.I4 TaxID=1798213 RepID=UPI001FCAA146|nr:autotransporter domain-containing protein [Pseudovibrio sp. Tun.PSC04-5.I4]
MVFYSPTVASIQGGNGGYGRYGSAAGGIAVDLSGGAYTIHNEGSIIGGNKAKGIVGSNIEITNSGTIQGGEISTGNYASAIKFGSGINRLTITSESNIIGRVEATTSTNDAFILGGNTSAFFNVNDIGNSSQYQGFETYQKNGSSTWTLTGTGVQNWDVAQGRLKGNTVSIQGDVDIAATAELELDQSNDGAFAGDISGAGQLIKSGTSTITLTGTNSYTGGTTINAGLLSISDMAQLGTGEILLNGGTFQTTGNSDLTTDKFDLDAAGGELDVSSKSFTLTGDVSTTSNLQKTGTGALVLDATSNTISGGTSVQNGSLIVGSTSGMSAVQLISDVTVENSAVLGGHGTIIGDVTNNNGRIAPGNSIGTTTITGSYSGVGSLEIEVEGDTKLADKLVVNGTVDVSGTALDLVLTPAGKADWSVDPTGPFIIVENDGTDAITGTFASVSDNLLFIDTTLDYAAGTNNNDIELTLTRNDVEFASSARTVNQKASGSAVQNLGSGNAVYNALIATVSDEAAAQAAFDSLSGEINASARSILIENSRFVRNAVNDRLYASATRNSETSGAQTTQLGSLTLWNTTFGSWGKADSDGNAASVEHSTGGVLFGADGDVFGNVRVGLTGGYSRTKVSAGDRNSSATSDNYTLGGYAGTQFNAFSLRAGTALTWHQIETERSVTVSAGSFTDELEADQNAAQLQAFGELGYGFNFGPTSIEPFAGLAHVHLMSQGFTEDGGASALSAKEQSAAVTFSTLGVRATSQFTLGGMGLTARGLAGWQHASNDAINFTQSFAGTGDTFTVVGTPIAKDIGILEAGLDLAINERAQFGLSYTGQLARESTKHGLTARLNLQF